MTVRLKLLYLIESYCEGKYRTWDFTSQFVKIFYQENDGTLTNKEKNLMKPLAQYAKYYSPSESDRQIYQGNKSDSNIKEMAIKTYSRLLKLYGCTTLKNIK